jgi:hypothetical protein
MKSTIGAFPTAFNEQEGMTLRDYFAAKAMQAMISNVQINATVEQFATQSYSIADAMIEVRSL